MLGGVAEQVADLQDEVGLAGEGGQAVGLGEGGGEGLFDEDVAVGEEGPFGEVEMGVGGGGYDDGVGGG